MKKNLVSIGLLRRRGTGLIRRPLPDTVADHLIADNLPAPTTSTVRAVSWTPTTVLNQGQAGACVGCGYTCEIIAEPAGTNVSSSAATDFAFHLWRRAKYIDTNGDMATVNDNDQGASMHSGALAGRDLGLFARFLWARSITDVRNAIAHGPVVIAVYARNWLMNGPNAAGLFYALNAADFAAPGTAGHCMCITAYDPAHPWRRHPFDRNPIKQPAYFIRNSWGDWGSATTRRRIRITKHRRPGQKHWRWKITVTKLGGGWIREVDLAYVLADWGWANGAAVLPIGRVDPDTLGGLVKIAATHPINAPFTAPADAGIWDPA